MSDDDDDLPEGLAHITPAYRRALWIVVGLNVGYGLAEMAGGFVSGSQALKADALDFLGDGLISFLGLLAIGWSLAWRARSALVQGLFLAVLGVGVLAATGYRVLVLNRPEAELMGLFGAVALAVNVAAAAVLGLGFGVFTAVDYALMTEVLPDLADTGAAVAAILG